jgi:hypothetical protein
VRGGKAWAKLLGDFFFWLYLFPAPI